eukprot:CAMPEP_0114168904 /NCGR_PEP_ID=MMETSP0043_2-20121206/33262_1 /TAXON_ID=464988 /ORGANISM="Hemiselmis andersenii, Strain CCMP644" /LENGTH=152 /DNA_ID=CAMNT_0001266287 /DNA_START=1 /DNA_END=455 /DNA_ORIENTATION=+
MAYLHELEANLSPANFSEFLAILEDFKYQMLSTEVVVKRVQAMLAGKPPSLVTGFNIFLPIDYHIKPQRFDVAMSLVKKIRQRFEATDPGVLSSFVDILTRFQADAISLTETRSKVRALLQGESDSLADFDTFLPPAPAASSSSQSSSSSSS